MSQYQLKGDRFYFKDYDKLPAFSSFLPGVAGVSGIPLWVFYTNRGQGVNSFGIHHKGNAIMEFNQANTAYENTPTKGFRTFLRKDGEYFEPFCGYSKTAKREMCAQKNSFSITEEEKGLRISVSYFVLPTEEIGALVRRVKIENISEKSCALEGIDGLPKIIPYGIQNGQFKEMSNLFKSWMDIKNIEHNAPYYAMRASSDDSAEVSEIRGGYFYCTAADGALLPVIYDAEVIFDYESSLITPVVFCEEGLDGVRKRTQCFANKVPCGFTPFAKELAAGEVFAFTSYIGYAGTTKQLNEAAKRFCRAGFAEEKEAEAAAIIDSLVKDVATKTADPVFDQYIQQCYLDNFLRGGYPYLFAGEGKKNIVHLFSRKHGDPERDYNFFSISGEYYSQGNGNFRDVCQNRRSDVFFHPEIGDFNVWSFFSYIQADGYNPLEIRPCTFLVEEKNAERVKKLVKEQVQGDTAALLKLLEGKFTPGQICTVMAEHDMTAPQEAFVGRILELSEEQLEAGFGEGYWSDHWDYLMDLVENYLLIFPDKKKELLTGRSDYRFYDSAGQVRPRRDTYVLSKDKVRQYGSLYHNIKKEKKPGFVAGGTNWVKDENGDFITTTLLGKMLTLALNKFLLLDQEGMGIEMEGGKPGWNDAMNGLPGLFGSSMAETFELNRLLAFLENSFADGSISGKIGLPFHIASLIESIERLFRARSSSSELENWEAAASLRESYRAVIYSNMSGEFTSLTAERICNVIRDCHKVVLRGIEKAERLGNGIMPTYFTYEVTDYDVRKGAGGNPRLTPYGLPGVQARNFVCHAVVPFLEGPARMLSCLDGCKEEKRKMCENIKNSDMYDEKLKMYKTSGSIESISMEHGRVRAFTPGWLERESVFLHMEYKYLLGLLRAGLTEEFYTAMHDALIPFLPPERYGRSTLENSSFLASGVNPDEKVHGRGFVARLSGSTTEMLSIWIRMFLGEGGFFVEDGALIFRLAPLLADWLFDENGEAGFTLLSNCSLTYHNPERKSTYGEGAGKVTEITLHYADGGTESFAGDTLFSEQAQALREGKIDRMQAQIS